MTIKYAFFSLLLVFFVSACTKISETEIGTGLIPPVDGVITKDTNISIDTKNWGNTDTISSSLYDDQALGYINDPVFGTTNAVVNLQLLPTFPFSFEANTDSLFLDSVVLSLATRGVWGDTMQNLSLHVKELENDVPFISDSTLIIYNNTSQFAATTDLTYGGFASIDPKALDDSFKFPVYGDSGINALRIRLTDDFGNRLLHPSASSIKYDSTLAFKTSFRGFQVSADQTPANNCLVRIGLANLSTTAAEPNTRLALYYRYKDTAGKTDTTVKYFTVNTTSNTLMADLGSAHSNTIQHSAGTGQIAGYYPPNLSTKNDNYIYLESAPGTYATITIDSAALNKLPNWIIHRADIVMEQAPDASTSMLDNFTTPYLFMLVKPDNTLSFQKDTTKFIIPGFDSLNTSTYDALFSSSYLANYADFGGVPLRKTNIEGTPNINYYNFDVSRYIQGIVTKKNPQYTFALYAPYREVFQNLKGVILYSRVSSPASQALNNAGVGRVRLYGGGADTTNRHRMKLHIVYSIPH